MNTLATLSQHTVLWLALVVTLFAPMVGVALIGITTMLSDRAPSEARVVRITTSALSASVVGSLVVLSAFLGVFGAPVRGEVEFGDWLRVDDFVMPAVLLVDNISVTISLFAALLTALIARFSSTYLHKEPGFNRFFALLGVFATGTQLVALAGALELFFAGWELIGISSALFIGFFHERAEPVRSSVRAFATTD